MFHIIRFTNHFSIAYVRDVNVAGTRRVDGYCRMFALKLVMRTNRSAQSPERSAFFEGLTCDLIYNVCVEFEPISIKNAL